MNESLPIWDIHSEITELFRIAPEVLDGANLKEDVADKMLAAVG